MATRQKKTRANLRAIRGGKAGGATEKEPLEEILSGRVSKAGKASRRASKREAPPQDLPRAIQPLANAFAAGRTIDKEMRFKLDYAKQKLNEYCVRDWVHRFAMTQRRPPSVDYKANHSKFKFVMTARTTLNQEKVEALREIGLPIDEHTVLRDLQINYDAIKQHGLEKSLKKALESMNLEKGVLEEVLVPKVELKDTFYDLLVEIVRQSLSQGEDLEEKILNVLEILDPAEQMRNVEAVDLSSKECFDLIEKTEIELDEEIA